MPFKFGLRGYIEPPQRHELSLEEFRRIFVLDFPESATRSDLFQKFMQYTDRFRSEITKDFIQWVGGSFTTRKLNPKDIDMVTFISPETFERKSELIDEEFRKDCNLKYGIDAYFVVVYHEGHEKHSLYQGNIIYWDHQFSKTKKNRVGNRFSRGYVQITHQKQSGHEQE
ncbi:MAG TPA: hypothetical protein PLL53_01610 [Saprospiraceae bacterium]|jgi:hypothetical protein|nr:hypothetical protein [Saprospiraceae bacterium]